MSRVGVVVPLLSLALCACQPTAAVGAACARPSDCATPLTCTYGRCRSECTSARDCAAGLRCIASVGGGVCTLDVEERCTEAICAAPLRCQGGQCRTECTTSADCRGGTCEATTCVEARSGDDAGMPPVDGGGSQCDARGHTALLDAVLGAGHGTSGLALVPPTVLGGFVSPQSVDGFVVGQLGLAERASASVPYAWVGYLEGAPDRSLRLVEIAADALADPRAVFPVAGGPTIDRVRSFALATDADVFRGVAALEPPATGSETSAWIFEPGATELMLSEITPMVMFPGQQPGRVAVVGGASPFTTLGDVQPLWYAFRETHEDGTTSTQVLGNIDRGIGVGSYASIPTAGTLPDGYLETSASHGPLLSAYDGAGAVVAWDLRPARDFALVQLAAGATGPPAIVFDVDAPDAATLLYPSGSDVTVWRVVCPAGGLMDCRTTGTARTLSFGAPVRRVAATAVRAGVSAVVQVDDASDRLVHLVVGRDATRVDECDGGCPPLLDVHPTSAGERIVDVRIASAPSPTGVAITIAALLRDETRAIDRVWLGGLWLCAP